MGNLLLTASSYQIVDTHLGLAIGWGASQDFVYISAIPKYRVSGKNSIQVTIGTDSQIKPFTFNHT